MNNIEPLYDGLADVFQVEVHKLRESGLEFNETNLDSLALISIIALVDEKYGVVLDGNEVANIKNLLELQNLITLKLSQ